SLVEGAKGLFETADVRVLLDRDVTRINLERELRDIASKVRSSDVFLLFVAGHGKTQDGKYFFIPYDFKYTEEQSIAELGIGQKDWQAWVALIAANKTLLMFDTCESGTLTNDMVARGGLDRLAALERLTRATGRSVLSAATNSGPALEGYEGHGVFA